MPSAAILLSITWFNLPLQSKLNHYKVTYDKTITEIE